MKPGVSPVAGTRFCKRGRQYWRIQEVKGVKEVKRSAGEVSAAQLHFLHSLHFLHGLRHTARAPPAVLRAELDQQCDGLGVRRDA